MHTHNHTFLFFFRWTILFLIFIVSLEKSCLFVSFLIVLVLESLCKKIDRRISGQQARLPVKITLSTLLWFYLIERTMYATKY